MTILLIIAALVLLGLVFCGSVYVSARRQGPLAFKVLAKVMGSRLGKWLLRKSGAGLGADGTPSVESLQEVMRSNPELIEKMAAQQGIDPSQVQTALKQFQSLNSSQQRRALSRAQAGGAIDPSEILTSPAASQARAAAQAKRKEAERRKRKQARKQKRR